MFLYMAKYLMLVLLSIVSANQPDWEYNHGDYEFTSWIVGGIVLKEGENLAADGDLFAAFDDAETVRGVAVQVNGFGPTAGQIMYEMTMGSNFDGDILSFQYYDASEDIQLDIIETYVFVTSEQQGDLQTNPVFYNIDMEDEDLAVNDAFLPAIYELGQNYPNPYNPSTYINYTIGALSNVTLRIYDVRGQLIAELLSEIHTPGEYKTIWNSSHLATGVYLLDMEVHSINEQLIFSDIDKMLYLK